MGDLHSRCALHLVLLAETPTLAATVQHLVQAEPSITGLRDCYANTPLFMVIQLATRPCPPLGVLQAAERILEAMPDSASHKATFGKLPLHLIAPGVTTTALDLARLIYQAYPVAAGVKDRSSSYPYQ